MGLSLRAVPKPDLGLLQQRAHLVCQVFQVPDLGGSEQWHQHPGIRGEGW